MRSTRRKRVLRALSLIIALVLVVVLILRFSGQPTPALEEFSASDNKNTSSEAFSSRVIAQPEHCDIQLNFHGQQDDFLLAQYWHQRLSETLVATDVVVDSSNNIDRPPTSLQFCAVLRQDLYTSECPDQLGRAWCAPQVVHGSTEEANSNTASESQIHVVLTNSGLANTRNGVIYIKRNASVQVLQHELGHALGLADEYTMHPELARQFCNGEFNFSASNLVVTRKQWFTPLEMREFKQALPWADFLEQPIGEQDNNGVWRLGSNDQDKVGLFAAKTCEGTGLYAWKPVAEKTWMEQHEIGEVPSLYLNLIRLQLQ